MYIFRNELELVCLVIGWGGGGLRLFIWGGRWYRVVQVESWGLTFFTGLGKSCRKHFSHAFHVNILALIMDTV